MTSINDFIEWYQDITKTAKDIQHNFNISKTKYYNLVKKLKLGKRFTRPDDEITNIQQPPQKQEEVENKEQSVKSYTIMEIQNMLHQQMRLPTAQKDNKLVNELLDELQYRKQNQKFL